ncbi:tyrosine-type recombinase/integrase [Neorhizobium galegae]|uniref:Tyrosine-type recombinase/integrase n=1 Tax=Neorhizobium galegae TaxID=399 RepID=A0A6A1TR30_NEOGA|nr:tyrosine-type recombinase/integrase [Neorhizobium galegae]KAB1086515.1 tyrosine-type recombinase/integrase [Neorhizobium galegae]
MTSRDLKGLFKARKILASGELRYYCYAWRGGPLLADSSGNAIQPDDPALPAAFEAAHEQRRNPQSNDLAMLIRQFRQSSDFRTKSQSSRVNYDRYLDDIWRRFGPLSTEELQRPSTRGKFKEWRDGLADKPRAADYAWSTLARVLSCAKDRGLLTVNICERGGRLYRADRADKVWSKGNIATFSALAPTYMRVAMLMGLWTGQRQGDLLRATWAEYDGMRLKVKQSKTGARVIVPVGKPLREALALLPRVKGQILRNSRGEPWTTAGFQTSWRKACEAVGITGLTFHDLRGTAVTRMALAGCTAAEIAAITGHSMRDVHEILDAHYLGGKVELAERAIAKLEAAEDLVDE